jgi:SOS-response transcriptional repressor LexA
MYHRSASIIPRQRLLDTWNFIHDYYEEQGYPPTIREIADFLTAKEEDPPWEDWSVSTSVVAGQIRRMQHLNMLERDPDVSRGLRLLEPHNWKDDPRWRTGK